MGRPLPIGSVVGAVSLLARLVHQGRLRLRELVSRLGQEPEPAQGEAGGVAPPGTGALEVVLGADGHDRQGQGGQPPLGGLVDRLGEDRGDVDGGRVVVAEVPGEIIGSGQAGFAVHQHLDGEAKRSMAR